MAEKGEAPDLAEMRLEFARVGAALAEGFADLAAKFAVFAESVRDQAEQVRAAAAEAVKARGDGSG